jgi:hypothetical protein
MLETERMFTCDTCGSYRILVTVLRNELPPPTVPEGWRELPFPNLNQQAEHMCPDCVQKADGVGY